MSKSKKSLSMRELGQRSNAGYMGGFSSVLLVWFYEKVGELEYTSDIERLPPLFCVKSTGKWRRTTMNKLYRVPKLVTDNGQENTPLIHTASPIVFESRKAELIFLIAEKTYELNELTTELRELEERSARCQKKTKEKEDDENVTEEKKIKEDMEAKEYENLEGTGEADLCDDFVMSPRDMRILEDARDVSQKDEGGNENNRETPSIKRAVGKRERKDGPSVTSPYMPLDQPKEGTKKRRVIQILDSPDGKKKYKNEEGFIPTSRDYPGKALAFDYENKLIEDFLQSRMNSDTYIWKCAEASVSRLDAYILLTGGELSDDVIDAFVIRLCNKIETSDSYDRKIHVTRPWLAQAFLEGNLEMVAKRMKENVSQQKFLECERILIPIVSSGHWHLVELVREETKFYHYSSINSPIYTADAVKFINKFMSFIESNWGLGKLEHHGLVSVAVPQQGPTLDCGIFMIEFINSIVEKRSITISKGDCAKYRARFCAALLYARDSPFL
ncbi:uncharacterized protein LOC109827704 [Asparagus officinalis]|nr:uncharacterized protein LOC109827704 [Asparagus officinalis]